MDGAEIWREYTTGVKKGAKPPRKPSSHLKPRAQPAPSIKKPAKSQPIVLDKRVEKQIRQGELEIDGKLDLHGRTQAEAHAALNRFITTRYAKGDRKLLIITGKGRAGESVLRTNTPRWCEEPRLSELILALRPAAAKHGGDGAFYVMLRKIPQRIKG
ncbi:MAG: Smr/MutS family protein [Alphaproteobacteria bacterium]|nr:Smr/MutS family protein [Alphaproteobacteria bacterium]